MTKAQILAKIAELEKELETVKGTTCEVFSRSVGYLRPTSQYNAGKQQEFKERVVFTRMGNEKV